MEERSKSGTFKSLSNSMSDLSDRSTASRRKVPQDGAVQMRQIADDYNALLKRATDEIKVLTLEKHDLEDQLEKLMSLNDSLARDVGDALQREKSIKQENEAVIKANTELFEEAQRLSFEEEKWTDVRSKLQLEIQSLKTEVKTLGNKLCETSFFPGDTLSTKSEEGQANKSVYHKTVSLQTQVQKLQDRCRDLERENGKLKNAGLSTADADLAEQQAGRYEKLLAKNRDLSEKMEQMQKRNRVLNEDNGKLKKKCQNLEELLSEEEADINDVLELIKKMQVTSDSSPDPGPMCPQLAAAPKLKYSIPNA